MKESREFLSSSTDPEPPRVVEQTETHHLVKLFSERRDSPELQTALMRIDFPWLNASFREIALKSRVDPRTVNLLGVDTVVGVRAGSLTGTGAYYDVGANRIGIDYMTASGVADHLGVDVNIFVSYLLFHEGVHATSKVTCIGLTGQHESGRSVIQNGYAQDIAEYEKPSESSRVYFGSFNEGVTERLARELFGAYVIDHPDFADPKKLRKFFRVLERDNGDLYSTEIRFVEELVRRLHRETEFEEEMIWGAIIRGEYEGVKLQDEDFKVLFAELFGPDFLRRLALANEGRHDACYAFAVNMHATATTGEPARTSWITVLKAVFSLLDGTLRSKGISIDMASLRRSQHQGWAIPIFVGRTLP